MLFFENQYFITILYVVINIVIVRGVCYLCALFKQNSEKEKLYIYNFNLKNDFKETFYSIRGIIFIICMMASMSLCLKNFSIEYFVTIFITIAIAHFMSYPDKNHLLEVFNLHIGYGAAIAYYKNYLQMTLTERFSERIDKFNSENMVTVRKKLFILVPQTCKVHRYLDSIDYENIERCRELPDEEISHAGIKNRKYNITIYDINGIRLAVEFAQPLKGLQLFKEKGLFIENEMLNQRNLFVKTLKDFLSGDPYKYFEIVDYDDSTMKISEVLQNISNSYDLSKSHYNLETV